MNGVDNLYIDCINYTGSEASYDYGSLSTIDATLSNGTFSNTKKSFKGVSSSSIQTVDYGVLDQGTHTLYIKYYKDNIYSQANDSLQFKIRFE